jgi:hypothetical protein
MIINYTISVNILPAYPSITSNYTISTTVIPASPAIQTEVLNYPFIVNIQPITINISEVTKQLSTTFFANILEQYIDEDRELKELLNYGEDRQSVIIAKRFGPIDSTGTPTIQLKLLQPVPDDTDIDGSAFISREIANSVIDKFRVRFAPEIDTTPYLRPKNTTVRVNEQLGKTLRNVTLDLLALTTGSLGGFTSSSNKTFEDELFRRWYSYDFNSSELNYDFSNYENFIFYGSATLRLEAFVQKLYKLYKLTQDSKQFEGSVFTGALASAGATYILDQSAKLAKEKENIIRSFDKYEQYLYFTPSGSGAAYSASFDYVDGGIEFNPIGYWPKKSNQELFHPTESVAVNWYNTQLDIAKRYDEYNPNNLLNTIPSYLRDDHDSAAYFTFVLMIGHFFDLIKPYIDQFPQIYSRNLNPNEELSKDLVYNIAESVGFPLPTLNSLYDISETVLGTETVPPRRDYAVETHKRILHNLPMFVKSKGTKAALRTALRTLGLAPQLLDVWETGNKGSAAVYAFEEFTNGLDFTTTNSGSITIPVSSSLRPQYPRSIELSIKLSTPTTSTLLEGDDKWTLNVVTHPTNPVLGRFEIANNSGSILMNSSYHEIFDDSVIHLSLKNNLTVLRSTLTVYEVDTYGVAYQNQAATTTSEFTSLWRATNNIYIGGTQTLSTGPFSGILDEFRLLGTNLTPANSRFLAEDPSSVAGNTFRQPAELLYVQLSFNKIDTSLLPTALLNESPYQDKATSPSIETITATNITLDNFLRYNRNIRQQLPIVGNSNYVSQKIYIAPPQQFGPEYISGAGVKQLSRTRSVVTNRKLATRGGRNKVIVTTSPTRILNDNIVRTMGATNINSALGIPSEFRTLSTTLEKLRNYYTQYYYVSINYNQYIRILSQIHSVLNDYIDYFIPSKASLLRGIVIEPTILEQVKLPPLRNIRFYGSKSRKTRNAASSLTGSRADYQATFNVDQTIDTRPEIELPASYDTVFGTVPSTISDPEVLKTTYDLQHLDWYQHQFISNSYVTSSDVFTEYQFLPRPKVSIPVTQTQIDSSPHLYDLQHLDWYQHQFISNSYVTSSDVFTEYQFLPRPKSSIKIDTKLPAAQLQIYDLQHLDWYEFQLISQSYDTGSSLFNLDVPDRKRFLPKPKVAIGLGYNQLNKFAYNAENKGTWGAEPYHRIYPRRLFDEEFNLQRPGGKTSLAPAGLYDIPPSSDFKEVGAYTYFNRPSGVYNFPITNYTPVYPQPLNATWDFDSQTFSGATTWSYGDRYVPNDVVYQQVTKQDAVLGELTASAVTGNGKYYVFLTSPDIAPPPDGTAWYSGSVPSYIPPSLDGTNWKRLRFKPQQIYIPRRIVFDTFTVPDPVLNNFKTTTLSIDTPVDISRRYIDLLRIPTIAANGVVQGEFLIQNIAALFALQSNNAGIRLRLYRTQDNMNSDLSRDIFTIPDGSHGVLADIQITEENSIQLVNPIITLVADSIPPGGKLFYTINNLTSTPKLSTTILMYYFAIQIEPRVPFGYLRKHYRFFRDNSTATKRRNYLGCKFSIVRFSSDGDPIYDTIDGLPPVQVFLSEGSTVTVNQSGNVNEIITGGGGTLGIS